MTYEEYERRAKAIDTWAQEQYAAGEMGEGAIERRVERMFDALDFEFAGPAPDLHQTRGDVDIDDGDKYPGWTSMQSALRDTY